ncbi:hypothetical protein [Lewinella sp. W8]|uniref:hypothetical protein n=1 Tax=Lewinella sp. W8 TaxID=2528208 RepID=UPI001067B3DF|nr:hypothetical protein [Lewinella sp. W8]MTB51370.1 hypothetical protein [Lewinella sp. W8]
MRTLLFLLFLFLGLGAMAQPYQSRIHYKVNLGDTTQLHQLILLDYTKLLGTVMEVRSDSIRMQVRSVREEVMVPTHELRFIGVFNSTVAREYTSMQPAGFSDLTYERTALPFTSKTQLRVINLIYAVVERNIGDNFQIGIGLAGPLGLLTTQKLRFQVAPKVNVGLSNQFLLPPFSQGFNSNGLLALGDVSGIVTFGDERRFLNLGTGLLYNTDEFGGEAWSYRMAVGGQLSPRWHVYTEVVLALEREDNFDPFDPFDRQLTMLPSINASLAGRRHRWQFGIFTLFLDEDDFFPPPLPYVGYSLYW